MSAEQTVKDATAVEITKVILVDLQKLSSRVSLVRNITRSCSYQIFQ